MWFDVKLATRALGLVMEVLGTEVWDVVWVCVGVCVLLMQGRLRLYFFVWDESLAPY